MYLDLFGEKPIIRELHLGGGTPTFFDPENLDRLMKGLLDHSILAPDYEFSFEAHPNNTTYEHLELLYQWGFRRLSIGVQDFSDKILSVINRQQTAAEVERVTHDARAIGYESINYDIIFGLPLQQPKDIIATARKIKQIKPDRIAYYSYAHVPWISPSQRAYSEADLPKGEEKRFLYELGRVLLEESGYQEIALDHFALASDELYQAMQKGTLHRNFMGYTPNFTQLSIGLGASAISDTWTAFTQNEKHIENYQEQVENGSFPIFRGHLLTQEDRIIRQHILNLMCRMETSWLRDDLQCQALYETLERLPELESDGLIELKPFQLKITEKGKPFMRNICMAFDARYWQKQPEGKLFSQVV